MASHCLRYVFHFNIVRSTKHFHILYINKLNYFRFFLFFSLIFILSCDSSKTYVLEGDKNLQGGHFDDAANYYYNALLIKKDNKGYRKKNGHRQSFTKIQIESINA